MTIQQTERAREILMDDVFVKHMVERFLAWPLPRDFNPDHGIKFTNPFPHLPQHWPSGTNLFGYDDALAMVRHMLEGAPTSTPQTSEEVVEAVARAELPDDDEPKTWRELAEAAIADLRSYAFDEYAHRRLVSAEAYEERAKLLAAMPPIPQESDAEVTEAQGMMSVPMYDRCDTYVAGQYVFNYLRTFLAAAGIDASKCKLVVELPDRDTQRQLVSAVQRDSKGPPRSAGRIGNHSGLWQGVEYEFSVKGWNDPTAMTSARDREQPK